MICVNVIAGISDTVSGMCGTNKVAGSSSAVTAAARVREVTSDTSQESSPQANSLCPCPKSLVPLSLVCFRDARS